MKRKLTNSQWELKLEREKKDFFQALRTQKSIVEGKGLTVNIQGRYETPKSDFVVTQNDGSWLKFDEKRKNGNRIYINKINKQLSKYLYAFASFLRKDGIDDKDVMKYYIIHLLCYNVKFFYKLKVEFNKTEPLIDDIVNWAMKKDTSKVKAGNLTDKRKMVAPENITVTDEKTGLVSIKKLNKGEKISLLNEARGLVTDKKIKELYNPNLTDKENCAVIGVGISTLRRWIKKQKNNGLLETKEEKIKRLYNNGLTIKENCKIIGCSPDTLKKYIKKVEVKEKIEPTKEVEMNDILDEVDDSWLDEMLESSDY